MRALAPCCLASLALACAAEPAGEDLLAALPHAEVRAADRDLLYSPAVARRGWGRVESDPEGSFRWAVGAEAELDLFALAAGDLTLGARVRGAVAPGGSGQRMTVRLNGREVGRAELAAEWTNLELTLPAAALLVGSNRLTLVFARPVVTAAIGAGADPRPLAACFRRLRFGPPRPEGGTRLELAGEALAGRLGEGWQEGPAGGPPRLLPPSASMRLDVAAPADRRITLTARRPPGAPPRRLEVWLNGHQLAEQELGAEWSELAAEAPREEWLAGGNRLMLRPSGPAAPAESRSAELARVVVDTLGEPAPLLLADDEGGFVRQRGGTALDLFRRLPAGEPRLRLAARGPAARVVLQLEPEGGGLVELWRGGAGGEWSHTVELTPWAGSLVRLRLAVLEGGGLAWRRVEIEGGPEESAPPPPPGRGPAAAAPPNLLLYVVDTLRADRTSLYGYRRATTPRLDRLAAESIVFDPAWANASWTRPGTATLLTGALPSVHGAVNTLSRLAAEVELVSESLRRAGYATYGLVTNPNLRPQWGIDRGWDEYTYLDLGLEFGTSSAALNELVLPRLDEWAAAGRPFFLYLHSMDPHAPYRTPAGHRQFVDPGYAGPVDGSEASVQELLRAVRRDGAGAHRADIDHLSGLYDGLIHHNDEQIGRLLDALAARGLLATTAVLVTSDHGEEFFEHGGAMHGHSLYQEQIDIPMLLRPPGGTSGRRVAGAQQVDVAVMLSALAGAAPPRSAIGRDLVSAGAAGERPVFAEEELRDRRLWSYVEGGMKLHYNRNSRHARWQRQSPRQLFDLTADPGETRDLWAARPIVAGYLLERTRALAARLPSGAERELLSPEELGEDLRAQLRALGYLQ